MLALSSQIAFSQSATAETDRLVATGKLWVTVKYFHPYLAYRHVDWDKALVDALPKIRAASNNAEYASALESMLDAVGDRATYVIREPAKPVPASLKTETTNGILIVSQAPGQPDPDAVKRLTTAIHNSRAVVFDLRSASASPDYLSQLLDDESVAKELLPASFEAPAQRKWVHNGLAPESGGGYSGYHSAFYLQPGPRVPEVAPPGPHRNLAFLLDETSHLPGVGCALLAKDGALVFAESMHYQSECAETVNLPMSQGIEAIVRLSEPVRSRGVMVGPHADLIRQALAALTKRSDRLPGNIMVADSPSPQPESAYAENRYPSTELRILAAYKIWGVFHYFFAYRDLMDEDWDDLLPVFLPKFIAAKDAREYNLTIAEMITHVSDSHAVVRSEELSDYFGRAPVGLRLRLIERKPLITQILDDEANKAGVQVGDIVTKVDGENIVDRFNRESRYISASTTQWHGYRVIERILNGPEGSTAALTIAGQDGRTREINLKRSTGFFAALRSQRTGELIKLLPGNIGYADLDRLIPDQVDGMFYKFRDTKAIIFDMRGYPHRTAWFIATRLTDQKDVPAAIFTGPLTLTPDLPNGEALISTASYFFVQKLSAPTASKYKGKTVMLIDERTISQAEHTGLFFEAANKTEFIGTPSAGADGDVSNFVVPGGITINFSGHDVRHANGGKLQRVGLQPAVTVAPTIEGIRHGRDEVLENAIEYVAQ